MWSPFGATLPTGHCVYQGMSTYTWHEHSHMAGKRPISHWSENRKSYNPGLNWLFQSVRPDNIFLMIVGIYAIIAVLRFSSLSLELR